MKRQRFRTVFLSDVHLGSRGCRAAELQRFLKRIDCDELYLVGDIVDFWRIRKRAFWPPEHNEVLRRLLKLVARGTRVVFIPGNHDEAIREFCGQSFGGIEIRREAVHECRDGRLLLVVHGDEYDLVVRQARLLSLVGSWAYESLIVLDRHAHRLRRRLGRPEWSLAQAIKLRVKSACTFLSRFEEALAAVARSRGLDGVVCGHVHQPASGHLGQDVAYFNCGDWIENCSALVETVDGHLQLVGRDLEPLEARAMNATPIVGRGPVAGGVAGAAGARVAEAGPSGIDAPDLPPAAPMLAGAPADDGRVRPSAAEGGMGFLDGECADEADPLMIEEDAAAVGPPAAATGGSRGPAARRGAGLAATRPRIAVAAVLDGDPVGTSGRG